MRPIIAAFLVSLLAPLALSACGSDEHKTVVVTPPGESTTVVDQNGNAHVVTHDHD